jgi:hypothetical protein
MTVAELRNRISAAEFTSWAALEDLDPWGQARDDYRFALLTAVVANSAGSLKKNKQPWSVEDFLLRFVEQRVVPPKPQTADQIEAMLALSVRATNKSFAERGRYPRAS